MPALARKRPNNSSCSGLTRASTSFLRARPPRRKAWILGSSPRMTNGRRGDTLARFLLPSGAFELQADPEREGAMAEGGRHHHVPATDKTVHWGYFSKALKPILEVASGDLVTVETLTHCATDDEARMI